MIDFDKEKKKKTKKKRKRELCSCGGGGVRVARLTLHLNTRAALRTGLKTMHGCRLEMEDRHKRQSPVSNRGTRVAWAERQ